MSDLALEELVRLVRAAPKYSAIAEDFVRRIAAEELAKGRGKKELLKAVRSRLHQVGAVFLEDKPDFPGSLVRLQAARAAGSPAFRDACRSALALHASTRERLPFLETFYPRVLAGLPPLRSVLDLACGLNPLAIPWMPLAPGAQYRAYDIHAGMLAFVGGALGLMDVQGEVHAADISNPRLFEAVPPADLALLLKTLPTLEQAGKDTSRPLLERIPARWLVVSFPLRSLGGRGRGMEAHYTASFEGLVAGLPWKMERFDFPNERVWRLEKPGG